MSDKYIGLYDEIKRNSLLKSIHEAARKAAEGLGIVMGLIIAA